MDPDDLGSTGRHGPDPVDADTRRSLIRRPTSLTRPRAGNEESTLSESRITVHRLRDLDAVGRWVAAAVLLLLALPFVVSLVRLDLMNWTISGDDALLGLRSLDVFSGDAPLIGQPSTSETAGGGIRTYHPGPIEMYLFAPLVVVLGGWGMAVGGAVVNLLAVLTVAWVVLRRSGPGLALVAVAVLALIVRSVGLNFLADPVSSNMWGLPIVAVAVCCWAVADGDHRLLALTAVWASWAAQQHLAAVVPVVALVGSALVALAAGRLIGRIHQRPAPSGALRWLALAAALALVLWSPVIAQQLTGDPGNLTAVIDFAGAEGRTTLGFPKALHITVRAFWPVPVVLNHDLVGNDLITDPGSLATAATLMIVVIAATIALLPAAHRQARLLLATGLVLLPAGLANTSNIPGNTAEVLRLNSYRWIWPCSTLLIVGLVWAAGGLVGPAVAARARRRFGRERSLRFRSLASPSVAVAVTAAVVVSGIIVTGSDDRPVEPHISSLARQALAAVRGDMGDAGTVLLIAGGPAAELAIVPSIAFALERSGTSVAVPRRVGGYFGRERVVDGEDYDVAYVVSGLGRGSGRPVVPGRVVADLVVDGRMRATIDELSPSLARSVPVINARGEGMISRRDGIKGVSLRLAVRAMPDDPTAALLNPDLLEMIAVDGVDGVDVDASALDRHRRLLAEGRNVWSDRRLLVLRLEQGEVDTLLATYTEGER